MLGRNCQDKQQPKWPTMVFEAAYFLSGVILGRDIVVGEGTKEDCVSERDDAFFLNLVEGDDRGPRILLASHTNSGMEKGKKPSVKMETEGKEVNRIFEGWVMEGGRLVT